MAKKKAVKKKAVKKKQAKKPKEKKPVGRPTIEFSETNWTDFRKLCKIFATKEEIADFFDVSEDTIDRRVKEKFGITFREIWDKYSQGGKLSLRRQQFINATVNNNTVMQIFLGKQYLGQSDRSEDTVKEIVVNKPGWAPDE